jgi:DNA-binding LacI/PurR family transcriptional regulator
MAMKDRIRPANPTISEVARRAGVSKAAVSFALNGRSGVSPETRARIVQLAAEMGFVPNSTAQALSTHRSGNLGLVLRRRPELWRSDSFFMSFLAGVDSISAPSGNFLLVRLVNDTDAENAAYRDFAQTERVDGVFVIDLRTVDPRLALLDTLGLTAVTLNRPLKPSSVTAVCVDDDRAIRDAVGHLIHLGHRTIGHIAGPSTSMRAADLRRVWEDALRDVGAGQGSLMISADFSATRAAEATRVMLHAVDPPTAILFASDLMAVAGLSVAQNLGLQIPEDLSLIGYGDDEFSEHLPIPLTTVKIDCRSWGEVAATTLLTRLSGVNVDDIHLPAAQLVVRASTGRAP